MRWSSVSEYASELNGLLQNRPAATDHSSHRALVSSATALWAELRLPPRPASASSSLDGRSKEAYDDALQRMAFVDGNALSPLGHQWQGWSKPQCVEKHQRTESPPLEAAAQHAEKRCLLRALSASSALLPVGVGNGL